MALGLPTTGSRASSPAPAMEPRRWPGTSCQVPFPGCKGRPVKGSWWCWAAEPPSPNVVLKRAVRVGRRVPYCQPFCRNKYEQPPPHISQLPAGIVVSSSALHTETHFGAVASLDYVADLPQSEKGLFTVCSTKGALENRGLPFVSSHNYGVPRAHGRPATLSNQDACGSSRPSHAMPDHRVPSTIPHAGEKLLDSSPRPHLGWETTTSETKLASGAVDRPQ